MTHDQVVVFSLPWGWTCLVCRDGLVRELTFGHADPRAAVQSLRYTAAEATRPGSRLPELARRLQRFAEHAGDDFQDVDLDLGDHTPFQAKVIAECRRIPVGETRSYGELAAAVGHPGAARAVGTVMSTNRFPLLVPCHRVVGAGGALGGYSAPEGLAMKRRLLAHEAAVCQPG